MDSWALPIVDHSHLTEPEQNSDKFLNFNNKDRVLIKKGKKVVQFHPSDEAITALYGGVDSYCKYRIPDPERHGYYKDVDFFQLVKMALTGTDQ
ncbi:MAG: hypothetical protein VKJ06_05810 [Vampirovibrionales bacterium]|nr:hypothetical protein [Vampirovibrionales bacterium]